MYFDRPTGSDLRFGGVRTEWHRTAAYVVCRDEADRLLLTRFVSPWNPDTGKWTMSGGGMEWGESPAETALRELREETGLRGRIGSVVGIYSGWFDQGESASGEPGHVIGIIYEAIDFDGILRTEFDEGTTDAVRWFEVGAIQRMPRVDLVDFVLDIIA